MYLYRIRYREDKSSLILVQISEVLRRYFVCMKMYLVGTHLNCLIKTMPVRTITAQHMFLVQFKLSLHIDLGLGNSNKLALQIFIRKLLFMNKYLIMVDSEKILVSRADYINIFLYVILLCTVCHSAQEYFTHISRQ